MFYIVLMIWIYVVMFAAGVVAVVEGIKFSRSEKKAAFLFLLAGNLLLLFGLTGFSVVPDKAGFTTYRKIPVTAQVVVDKGAVGEAITPFTYKISFDLVEKRNRNLFTREWGEKKSFSKENLKVEEILGEVDFSAFNLEQAEVGKFDLSGE